MVYLAYVISLINKTEIFSATKGLETITPVSRVVGYLVPLLRMSLV